MGYRRLGLSIEPPRIVSQRFGGLIKMEPTRAGTWRGLRLDLISDLIFCSISIDNARLS